MKKIAISALLIGLMGFAQAEVSVYGMARVYEESSTVGSAASVSSLTNDKSRFGLAASNDIGNGAKAFAIIETDVVIDSPAAGAVGARTALVGLSNTVGSLALGRDKTPLTKSLDAFDAMGGNLFGSSAVNIHSYQETRLSNSVVLTASPVEGFNASYMLSNSEVAGTPNPYSANLVYANGPVSATYARYDNGVSSLTNAYGAKFNMAKTGTTVFGLYSDNTVAGVNTIGKSIGVSQAVAPKLTAIGSYGVNGTLTAYNLGVNYDLAKSTKVLGRYLRETNTADTTRYGVGLEYSF